jgi:hypothetical protein
MTAIENTAELEIHCISETELVVDPSDISFHDLNRDTVMIQIKIRNEGQHRSNPAIMRLESAPFGAFVPWRPLATLPVPALDPGESRVLGVAAPRPHPAPLGDFDGVPPTSVLTALDASPEQPSPQRGAGVLALIERLRQRQTSPAGRVATKRVKQTAFLPPDLWQYFGREQVHWAGNINVFVGNRAVERHIAKALRIHAGRTNLAMFVVGGAPKRDSYAFELSGLASDWKTALYDMTRQQTLVIGASDAPVQENRWVEASAGCMLVMLAVRPPLDCTDGNVQVHVTRQSSQQTAVVEFNLTPTAQGPGCYVL